MNCTWCTEPIAPTDIATLIHKKSRFHYHKTCLRAFEVWLQTRTGKSEETPAEKTEVIENV